MSCSNIKFDEKYNIMSLKVKLNEHVILIFPLSQILNFVKYEPIFKLLKCQLNDFAAEFGGWNNKWVV